MPVMLYGYIKSCARLHEDYAKWWQNFTIYCNDAIGEMDRFIDDLYKYGKVYNAMFHKNWWYEHCAKLRRESQRDGYDYGNRLRKIIEDEFLQAAYWAKRGK